MFCLEAFAIDLERLISSGCRRKILKVLRRVKWLSVMELVRRTNSTYSQVNLSLQILGKEDIIREQRLGRMRYIRLNRENPRTILLLQALTILESDTLLTKRTATIHTDPEKINQDDCLL
jgi:DNA-binding transcriptional ArsR family regulator